MAISDKDRRAFHPAVSISSWLLFALAVELAAPSQLQWFALPIVILLAKHETLRRFAGLSWKARWLLLALVLLYAWSIPGTLIFPSDHSPTQEGLQAGLMRVGRLVLLLAALARLLSEFSARELAGGIYILAQPFALLGLDPRALAVRLALTLEQVEQLPKTGKWLEQLQLPTGHSVGPEEIRLVQPPVGLRDTLVLFAAFAMLGVILT